MLKIYFLRYPPGARLGDTGFFQPPPRSCRLHACPRLQKNFYFQARSLPKTPRVSTETPVHANICPLPRTNLFAVLGLEGSFRGGRVGPPIEMSVALNGSMRHYDYVPRRKKEWSTCFFSPPSFPPSGFFFGVFDPLTPTIAVMLCKHVFDVLCALLLYFFFCLLVPPPTLYPPDMN